MEKTIKSRRTKRVVRWDRIVALLALPLCATILVNEVNSFITAGDIQNTWITMGVTALTLWAFGTTFRK